MKYIMLRENYIDRTIINLEDISSIRVDMKDMHDVGKIKTYIGMILIIKFKNSSNMLEIPYGADSSTLDKDIKKIIDVLNK